jgi:CxxC motif-containing protein
MELVCIVCPNGCRLTVTETPDGISVTGNKCMRGEQYGKNELTDPRRMITAVVRTTDPSYPCVPVKSDKAVSKALIKKILGEIYRQVVSLPVKRGDVCIDNCCGSGTAILYTRSLPPVTPEQQS